MAFRTTNKPAGMAQDVFSSIERGGFQHESGIFLQQHKNAPAVFSAFFAAHPDIDLVIELGAGAGGFSLLLKDECDKIGAKFITYEHSADLVDQLLADPLFLAKKIDVRCADIYRNPAVSEIVSELTAAKRALLLCDGVNKILEFNLFGHYLNSGSIIMAHDYAPNAHVFNRDYKNKIWNWHEIGDDSVRATVAAAKLVPYYPDFNSVAWLCCIKQ